MNELSQSDSRQASITNSEISDSRKAEIIAEANIALTRLWAINAYEMPSRLTPLAVKILQAMAIGLILVLIGALMLIVGSPTFASYLDEKYPNSVQLLISTAPLVIFGVFVYLIYYVHQKKRGVEFLKLARTFQERIEELLRQLKQNQ